jgi:HK97 family phage portal protein
MAFWGKFYNYFSGNATSDRYGDQDSSPSVSAYDETANIGIDSAMQISTVWACVTLIAENMASLPLVPFVIDKDGSRAIDRDSDLYTILHDRPNGIHTAMSFWMIMYFNFILRGNAYAKKETYPNGELKSLQPLSSCQMRVVINDSGELLYRYQNGYSIQTYTQNQIFHVRGLGNSAMGLGVLDYMRASAGISIKAQNHLVKTFSKDARRPGILSTGGPVLNDVQRKAVKKNFGDIASGNGQELYLMEGGFKFEALGMSPADIQLLETRKFTVQDISRWFGVPSILANDTQETTSLGSSVSQIIEGFYKLKLRPMAVIFEQASKMQLLTPAQRAKRTIIEYNMDALLRANLSERMEIYAKSGQNGMETRNEMRRKENLPPLPGGDMLTVQSNLVPLDKLGEMVNNGGNVPPDPIRQ